MRYEYWWCRRCNGKMKSEIGDPPSHCPRCLDEHRIQRITKKFYMMLNQGKYRKYRQYQYHETLGEALAIIHGLPVVEYGGTDKLFRGM